MQENCINETNDQDDDDDGRILNENSWIDG